MTHNFKKFLAILCWAGCVCLLAACLVSCSGSLEPQGPTADPSAVIEASSIELSPTEDGSESEKAPASGTPAAENNPVPATPRPTLVQIDPVYEDPWSENGEMDVEWGEEVELERIVELAGSEDLFEVQWHVLPNVIRVLMNDDSIYHFRNEYDGVDIVNVLEDAGIKTGKGGISFRYTFCN